MCPWQRCGCSVAGPVNRVPLMWMPGFQSLISPPAVRDHRAAFDHRPPDETMELGPRGIGDALKPYPSHAFSADLDGNCDEGMESRGSACPALPAPSNECLVHLDGSAQAVAIWTHHGTSEFVQTQPGCPVAAQAESPL